MKGRPMDPRLRLPYPLLLRHHQFHVEQSSTRSHIAMLEDFYERFASGERWTIALVVEHDTTYDPDGLSRNYGWTGLMLLNENRQLYSGLYYPSGDCGSSSEEMLTTSQLLCTLNPSLNQDNFDAGFLAIYPRIVLRRMGTPKLDYQPL